MKNICIEVKNLTKKYGSRTVVDDLSFAVGEGEVFGLLGHNGAGKTTTIETALGLKKAQRGTVRLLGRDPRRERKQLFEHVGVQLQAANYQDQILVEEICQEMSVLYRKPADYRKLLRQFGLEEFRRSAVEKLSGGEKQKLSVVLALIPDPKIVFLDELTTGLDTAARREVWNQLLHLKEQGLTLFLTTHYMEEAQALCDRVLIMKQGRQVAAGTVNDVIERSGCERLEDAYLWYMEGEV